MSVVVTPTMRAKTTPTAMLKTIPSTLHEPLPRPLRNAQIGRHIVLRAVVPSHRRGRGPGEIVVQHSPEAFVAREAGVFQRSIEARDRAPVHFFVRTVAAVHPHDGGLAAVSIGVVRRAAEGLRPVGGETFGVL